MRKTCAEKRRITFLKDVKIRQGLEEKITELVDVGALNLWGNIKEGILKACDEVCGKRKEGMKRSKGDAWWWNEEVKEEV